MKYKAREFVEYLDVRSIPLLEQWAIRQRDILAVYAEASVRKRKTGNAISEKFRLEAFDGDSAGNIIDDSIYAVLIGLKAHPIARGEAEAYSHIDFFELGEEIAEICHEALDK